MGDVDSGGSKKKNIPEIVSYMKCAFRRPDFDLVEEMLVSREETIREQLSLEIRKKKKELELLEEKYRQLEVKHNLMEVELKKYQRDRDKLEEQVKMLKEDVRLIGDRVTRDSERNRKLSEEMKERDEREKEMLIELQIRNGELERSKRKAEEVVEVWKKKYGECESRVVQLEEDTALLMRHEAANAGSKDAMEKIGRSTSTDFQNKQDVGIGFNTSDQPTKENVANHLKKSIELAGGSSTGLSKSELRGGAKEPHSVDKVHVLSDDDMPAERSFLLGCNRKRTHSESGNDGYHTPSTNTTRDQTQPQELIRESKRSPADYCSAALVAKNIEKSTTTSIKNSLYHTPPSTNTTRDQTQPQELIRESKRSPADYCSAASVAKNIEKSTTTSIKNFLYQLSESSDSTTGSSNDDSNNDDYLDTLLSTLGRKNRKMWLSETDMVSAFYKDPQLCMEAVCALYRQQPYEENGFKRSSFSNNRGFDRSDALRGTSLAEFLIDGDSESKLKKSVLELKKHDPKGLDDCRRLAKKYSKQLFEIYQKKEDPLFLAC